MEPFLKASTEQTNGSQNLRDHQSDLDFDQFPSYFDILVPFHRTNLNSYPLYIYSCIWHMGLGNLAKQRQSGLFDMGICFDLLSELGAKIWL